MDISATYVGLTLRNPVIVAAAGITETTERIEKAAEAGAGAVIMKSFFDEEVCRTSPTPRFAILERGTRAFGSDTLYSFEQASAFGPEEYARELDRASRAVDIPVLPSLNCISVDSWTRHAKLVEEAGARAIELNLSCPYGPQIMEEQDLEGMMVEVVQAVTSTVRVPVVAKITGQLTDPRKVALQLERAGASALVLFNRFTGLEIELDTEQPIMHGSFAGHGGTWSLHYPLRWISVIAPHLSIPICATGGVADGGDVAKYLLAGATVVQICTAVYVRGYRAISEIVSGLKQFMAEKGYRTLAEFRGAIAERIKSPQMVDRRHLLRAVVDPDRCVECGRCDDICIYGAIESAAGPRTITAQCAGCGLCVAICPHGAITMVPMSG
jgi:dihydroorotate dehydrogenase (fumarate)